MIADTTHTENYISCLGKVGVAFVAAPIFTVSDSVVLRRNPLYRELNTVDLDTAFELYGQALSSTGFYAKGAKIGLSRGRCGSGSGLGVAKGLQRRRYGDTG